MRRPNRASTRQLLAIPPSALGVLVPGDQIVQVLAVWDIYALVCLALTWLTFRRGAPVAGPSAASALCAGIRASN